MHTVRSMRVLLLSIFTLLQGTAQAQAFDPADYAGTYNDLTTDALASDFACSFVYALGYSFEFYVHATFSNFGGGDVTVDGKPYAALTSDATTTDDDVYDYYRKVSRALTESQNSCGIGWNEVNNKVSYAPGKCVGKAIGRLTIGDIETKQTAFRAARDAYLKALNELALATGPYFGAYSANKANNNVASQGDTAATFRAIRDAYLKAMEEFMTGRAAYLTSIDELAIQYNTYASALTNMPTFDVPLFREFGDCGDSVALSENSVSDSLGPEDSLS